MRIAVISDVHANLEALKATLADIKKQKVDCTHFLGDAVGYGCEPNACVELITRACEIRLLGNHDSAALGIDSTKNFNEMAKESIAWTMTDMNDDCRESLADFEMEAQFDNCYLTHAAPRSPESWEYILSVDDAAEQFECFTQSIALVGHSHLPAVFRIDDTGTVSHRVVTETTLEGDCRYIINVGSVGQPRDHDPRACYITLDTDTRQLKYHRVAYDVARASQRIQLAGLPAILGERLLKGR